MISVCLTTYNGGKFLKQQLDSILNQLDNNDEVIISDDNSTDDTLVLIESYCDHRIKLLHHYPQQKGKYGFSLTSDNFQNALKCARGEYIFFADQDDIWKENKVDECVKLLQQGYDLILHDADLINEKNNVISDSYFKINNSKKGIFINLCNNSYLGCCMVINNKFLNKVLPFPNRPIPHDIWVGLIYEHFGKVIFTDKKLISYRRHGGNVSHSGEKSKNSFVFKLKYRVNVIFALLKKII